MTKEQFYDRFVLAFSRYIFRRLHLAFFPQIFLQFLHHLLVSLAYCLVVDYGPRIVNSDDASGLSLDGLWSFPGLVDELHWHSGELGQIFPDVDALGINLAPVILLINSLSTVQCGLVNLSLQSTRHDIINYP